MGSGGWSRGCCRCGCCPTAPAAEPLAGQELLLLCACVPQEGPGLPAPPAEPARAGEQDRTCSSPHSLPSASTKMRQNQFCAPMGAASTQGTEREVVLQMALQRWLELGCSSPQLPGSLQGLCKENGPWGWLGALLTLCWEPGCSWVPPGRQPPAMATLGRGRHRGRVCPTGPAVWLQLRASKLTALLVARGRDVPHCSLPLATGLGCVPQRSPAVGGQAPPPLPPSPPLHPRRWCSRDGSCLVLCHPSPCTFLTQGLGGTKGPGHTKRVLCPPWMTQS